MRWLPFRLAAICCAGIPLSSAFAEPVPRIAPAAGAIVATRLGEEIEFVETPDWRGVEVRQDVKTGDVLRTNAGGQLAILFSDQTQIRIGRNSTLVVKERVPGGDTRLSLESGSIFARAARGGSGVFVETAAATAAIRGTDWTMSVEGERTSLTVLEGMVEFANPQGSLIVNEGEAAAATLGSAPSKVIISAGDYHEQMLLHLSVRDAFDAYPVAILGHRELEQARARLAATPGGVMTPQDRVLAAEIALEREGRAAARGAIAAARRSSLTPALAARLDLLDGLIAGADGRYGEAARLIARARPHLSGQQASLADYQTYFARSLADPSRPAPRPAPQGDDRVSVVGEVMITALLETPNAALRQMLEAEPRFRGDAAFQATLARLAMAAGDYEAARLAVERAVAADADDPEVLTARARYRGDILYDREGALADLRAGIAAAPGKSGYWNDLGLLQSERGAEREAEAAFLRAIELSPKDPVPQANYAIFLIDQGRVAQARTMIDAAFAADPSFDIAYLARGRQQILEGDGAAATESFLKATTANPAYANGLVALSAAHAAAGEPELADQALKNAARIDPNDPVTAQFQAALALDAYEADEAITYARRSVELTRRRGGDFEGIRATRDSGSVLGGAYRFLSLDAWGRYYSDVTFDPFASGGYLDRALGGGANSFAIERGESLPTSEPELDQRSISYLALGLLNDPKGLAGSELKPTFLGEPFLEGSIKGGLVAQDGAVEGLGEVSVQSLGYLPVPYSLLASVALENPPETFARQEPQKIEATFGLGLQPTGYDRLVAFGVGLFNEGGIAADGIPYSFADTNDDHAFVGFAGWSHTFAHENVLRAAVFGQSARQDITQVRPDPIIGLIPIFTDTRGAADRIKASAGHLVTLGGLTFDYGGEISRTWADQDQRTRLVTDAGDLILSEEGVAQVSDVARGWLTASVELLPSLSVEGGLTLRSEEAAGDREDTLGARFGAAFSPYEGQLLRAGFIRHHPEDAADTLGPIGVVGLETNILPTSVGAVDNALLRWDAEWAPWFFTALDYQRQDIENLTLSPPAYIDGIGIANARIDRLAATGNLWLGNGLGLSGTLARIWSEGDLPGTEDRLPFVPDVTGRLALTYVHPSRLRLTVAETYLGARASNVLDLELGDAFVTDVSASWETPDRHLRFEADLFNAFDETVEVAPLVPAARRTLRASIKARF